jgi:fructan beta-fructosidase
MPLPRCCASVILLALPALAPAADRKDLLIADFEGETYGDWKATGTAFGNGPARGTLPGQMPVSGYLGKGLVNSFNGGDKSTGTLTAPPFMVERKYINFLVGGGKFPGKTCVNLLVDDKVVRTATGPNDQPGGSEALDWASWDVAELEGKSAVIQVVDDATGGWGHINVDHIVQSDRRRGTSEVRREFEIKKDYLNLPVKTGATKRRVRFEVDGKTVREFDIELADDRPDFFVFADVTPFRGKKLAVVASLPADSKGLAAITPSDEVAGAAELYREKYRPQFHFTSRRGWLNDPNGLVYAAGEWHLFYQHNPYGWDWGNMHWGHASSKDLFHWRELPVALTPRTYGDWCFSGSAVVDRNNTSGWRNGDGPLLVCAFTSTGRGECIAYSNDQGRTWTEYDGNPVVKHGGRDPKLVWHAATKKWVMAVYDERDGRARDVAFYTSPDLKKWEFGSRIGGFFECPDLYPLAVDGDAKKVKWVLSAADGRYMIGQFDGTKFVKESGKHQVWYGNFYAAQTFDSAPLTPTPLPPGARGRGEGGRRVQIGWGNGITFPGMPFNQQMTVPVELTLRTTDDGVRLFAEPVKEIESLRDGKHAWKEVILKPDTNPLAEVKGELFDLSAEVRPAEAEQVTFTVRGVPVVYGAKKGEVSCRGKAAPLKVRKDGTVRLRILVDRGSIEVFGNDGQAALSVGVLISPDDRSLALSARGGEAKVNALEVNVLKSAWK